MSVMSHRKAQAKYQKSPIQKKKRAARNKARATMIRKGLAHKGDGKDIDHKDGNPLHNTPSNWRVRSRAANRSLKRDSHGHKIHRNGK